MRVLVTDGDYKHSIAIQHYIRKYDRSIHLLAHQGAGWLVSRLARLPNRTQVGGDLESALRSTDFDMVIPVGARSVVTVAHVCPEKAVLPSWEAIRCCLDKRLTAELARKCSVPTPETWAPQDLEEALALEPVLPCVIKPRDESQAKFVLYARDREELRANYSAAVERCTAAGAAPPLIQRYVGGVGTGLFALYDRGSVKWVFMHRRIREWPITGGASTAAEAFHSPKLRDYGIRLLDELEWHGVAMVEFKYSAREDQFWLMEINPKFWGSSELALRAGVNFPAGLIRVFRGESLDYSERYNYAQKFYWPLPDDLRVLRQTRQLERIREYFQHDAATNLFQHPALDVLNLFRWLCR